jgi:hypothetical protein
MQVPNCNFEASRPTVVWAASCLITLYRNNGDGTFTDVSKESGVSALHNSYGFTTVAFDIDEDGWQDIFVACDATPSLLLMNNHDGTFREEALLRGVALGSAGEPMGGMGVGIGDFDLDGHIDLVKTHFVNQATDSTAIMARRIRRLHLSRRSRWERRFSSWGTGLVDLDNDGCPDIHRGRNCRPELNASTTNILHAIRV